MELNVKLAQSVSQVLEEIMPNKPVHIHDPYIARAPAEGRIYLSPSFNMPSIAISFDSINGIRTEKLITLFEICKLEQFKNKVNTSIEYDLFESFEPQFSSDGNRLNLHYKVQEGSINATDGAWDNLVNQLNA